MPYDLSMRSLYYLYTKSKGWHYKATDKLE